MQRWFYANEELICERVRGLSSTALGEDETPTVTYTGRYWRFCVTLIGWEIMPNEKLAVTGNCDQLGNWLMESSIIMKPVKQQGEKMWEVIVDIPLNKIIAYRYLIVAVDPEKNQRIVRQFESHRVPRKINAYVEHTSEACDDIYGLIDENVKVERGWVTTESILQLMFFNAPFEFRSESLQQHIFRVKVTPAFRKDLENCFEADSMYTGMSIGENSLMEFNELIENENEKLAAKQKKEEMEKKTEKEINKNKEKEKEKDKDKGKGKGKKKEKDRNRDKEKEKQESEKEKQKGKEKENGKDKVDDQLSSVKSNKKFERKCEKKKIPSFTKLNLSDDEGFDCSKKIKIKAKKVSLVTTEEPQIDTNTKLSTTFAFNEVTNLSKAKDELHRQPTFGTLCEPNEMVMFHLTIGDFDNTVYLIELFTNSHYAGQDEQPYRVGYRYLLPEDFGTHSQGYIEAPIICASTHRRLGTMTFRFLIVRPFFDLTFDLSVSFLRHWSMRRGTYDVGHRGLGVSHRSSTQSIIYENTIYSMEQAIFHGADMVEFDVQLTKNLVPVITHDFTVKLSQTQPNVLQDNGNIRIPVTKYTYEELQKLQITSTVDHPEPVLTPIADAAPRQKLFPSLADMLTSVQPDIAFDIEIKWPEQYCDGIWAESVLPQFDLNFYVDRILAVILERAKQRRIVLSSFDVDTCTLLRYKQNRFPVMLILRKSTSRPSIDPRPNCRLTALNTAYALEFMGTVPHADTVLEDPYFMADSYTRDLTVFCYGTEGANNAENLKELGVGAIILDRIDKLEKYSKDGGEKGAGDAPAKKDKKGA